MALDNSTLNKPTASYATWPEPKVKKKPSLKKLLLITVCVQLFLFVLLAGLAMGAFNVYENASTGRTVDKTSCSTTLGGEQIKGYRETYYSHKFLLGHRVVDLENPTYRTVIETKGKGFTVFVTNGNVNETKRVVFKNAEHNQFILPVNGDYIFSDEKGFSVESFESFCNKPEVKESLSATS